MDQLSTTPLWSPDQSIRGTLSPETQSVTYPVLLQRPRQRSVKIPFHVCDATLSQRRHIFVCDSLVTFDQVRGGPEGFSLTHIWCRGIFSSTTKGNNGNVTGWSSFRGSRWNSLSCQADLLIYFRTLQPKCWPWLPSWWLW